MTPDEARDIARLGGRAATGIAGLVEHTHHGITERVYRTVGRLTGGASRPIHATHDLVARHTFFWVQRGLEAGAWAAQVIAARAMGEDRGSRSGLDGVRAQLALGIVNGVTGDRLAADASTLAIPMSLRHEGRDVAPTAEGCARHTGWAMSGSSSSSTAWSRPSTPGDSARGSGGARRA